MRGSPHLAKHLILDGQRHDLEDVRDEIFMDLHEGPGTQFLAGTCYGQAVLDCKVIGNDYFILKVRPDLRALLLSQLRKVYMAFRVYRLQSGQRGRVLLTNEVLLQFSRGASPEARRASLQRYFPGAGADEILEDGIYRLAGSFSEDPILVTNALQANPMITAAIPLIVAIPEEFEERGDEDLVSAEPRGDGTPPTD